MCQAIADELRLRRPVVVGRSTKHGARRCECRRCPWQGAKRLQRSLTSGLRLALRSTFSSHTTLRGKSHERPPQELRCYSVPLVT